MGAPMSDTDNAKLREFQIRAEHYCDWVRRFSGRDKTHAMREAQTLLAALHSAWLEVPQISGTLEDVEVESENGRAIRRMFCEYLPVDGYLTVPESFDFDDKANPYMGSLPNDLSDIYANLEEGLKHWRDGRPFDAYFHWDNLYLHWGLHLTGALKALFDYFRDPDGAADRQRRVWNDVP